MTISFPVALPTTKTARQVRFTARSVVGMGRSPFSGSQQVYAHAGTWWEAAVELPPMERADAEEWIAFLLKLNGREGTFTMGDPANPSPRGTWSSGSPKVYGGVSVAGGRTLAIYGLTDGLTIKAGDWLQLGSGSTSHLHKAVADATIGSSPSGATLDLWPYLRATPVHDDAIVVSSAKGLWRLASNQRDWSVEIAQVYGLSFSCIEALSA